MPRGWLRRSSCHNQDYRTSNVKYTHEGMQRLFLAAICAWIVYSQPGYAEYESDVLFLPFIEVSERTGLSADSTRDSHETDYGLDLFAAIENRKFVFLGEALVSKDEQEIERLQFGWRIGKSKAWLGRFHNPIGYWNTQFHHGAYLQTSVSRPAIVEYEEHDGVLPMHLTGLLIEGIRERDDRGLGYAFAIALGPELSEEPDAIDVLNPAWGSQGLALTINLYRQPVVYGPNQYGLFANYTEIPASDRGFDEIRQIIAGGYWNWESDPWRLLGSAFHTRNRLDQGAIGDSDTFLAAYLQAERRFSGEWTVFGRLEKTFAGDTDRGRSSARQREVLAAERESTQWSEEGKPPHAQLPPVPARCSRGGRLGWNSSE